MTQRFVIDASVSLAWFLREDDSGRRRYAESVLDRIISGDEAWVPDHWHYEIASALLRAYRDAKLSRARLNAAVALLETLPLRTISLGITAVELIRLAERYHLQGYDALYFHLAVIHRIPIAALDHGIRTACRTHKVSWLAASPAAA